MEGYSKGLVVYMWRANSAQIVSKSIHSEPLFKALALTVGIFCHIFPEIEAKVKRDVINNEVCFDQFETHMGSGQI